jgi:hypothetical protein
MYLTATVLAGLLLYGTLGGALTATLCVGFALSLPAFNKLLRNTLPEAAPYLKVAWHRSAERMHRHRRDRARDMLDAVRSSLEAHQQAIENAKATFIHELDHEVAMAALARRLHAPIYLDGRSVPDL